MPDTLYVLIQRTIDETAGPVFWPQQELFDAANEATLDMWAQTGDLGNVGQAMVQIPFVVSSGTELYTWDTSRVMVPKFLVLAGTGTGGTNPNPAPPGPIGFSSEFNVNIKNTFEFDQTVSTSTTSGTTDFLGTLNTNRYWITDQAKLEQYSRVWKNMAPQQPKWFVKWDASHLRVWPTPDQQYTFQLWGVTWPAESNVTNLDINVDPQYKLAIAHRAASILFEYTRPDLADAFLKESDEVLYKYRMRLRNIQRHNIRRLRPPAFGGGTAKTIGAFTGTIKLGRRLP